MDHAAAFTGGGTAGGVLEQRTHDHDAAAGNTAGFFDRGRGVCRIRDGRGVALDAAEMGAGHNAQCAIGFIGVVEVNSKGVPLI